MKTTTYATRDDAVEAQIIGPIDASGTAISDEFDIAAIADAVLTYSDVDQGYVCTVDPEAFWAIVEDHRREDMIVENVPAFGHEFEDDLSTVWDIGDHGHPVSMRWDGEQTVTFYVLDPLDEVDYTESERSFISSPFVTDEAFWPGQYGSGEIPNSVEHELVVERDAYVDKRLNGKSPKDAIIAVAEAELGTVRDVVVRHTWDGLRKRARRQFRKLVDEVRDGTADPDDYRFTESMWVVTVEDGAVFYEVPADTITMAQAGIPADDVAMVEVWALTDGHGQIRVEDCGIERAATEWLVRQLADQQTAAILETEKLGYHHPRCTTDYTSRHDEIVAALADKYDRSEAEQRTKIDERVAVQVERDTATVRARWADAK